ncbi:hypothetical protein BDN71DRAFT_1453459 [Pleurotus eryngii]|uniref:Uncharacterized protein n=1 Tax=Pleurotus eryngii TaxID=5323 RepID=A0A9P6D4U2_PLEER|nr:hypothetical protein BDN71DRAFT_1453459 [Pleurotus eryngii]
MVFTYQSKYRRRKSSSSKPVSSSKTASSSKTGGSILQSQAKGKGKNPLWLRSLSEDADSDKDDLDEDDTGDEPIVSSKQQLMGSSLRDWASSRLSKLGKGDDETRRMVLGLTGMAPMASASPSDSLAIPLSSPVRKAYEETNHGLKGARKGSLSKSLLKGKGKSKKDDDTFFIGTVVFLPYGVDTIKDDATEEEIELGIRYRLPHRSSKAPHIALMQTFQAQGLALVNLRPPGIEFDHSEDHVELASRLTGMFPKVFQHLFGLEAPNMDTPWLLCSRGKKNSLMLVPHVERPSGEDVYKQALIQGRSGFTSKTIYFTTCQPIPQETLHSWIPGFVTHNRSFSPDFATSGSSSNVKKARPIPRPKKRKRSVTPVSETDSDEVVEVPPPSKRTRQSALLPDPVPSSDEDMEAPLESIEEVVADEVVLEEDHVDSDSDATVVIYARTPGPSSLDDDLMLDLGSFSIDNDLENPWGARPNLSL